jgi:hypothetical protein
MPCRPRHFLRRTVWPRKWPWRVDPAEHELVVSAWPEPRNGKFAALFGDARCGARGASAPVGIDRARVMTPRTIDNNSGVHSVQSGSPQQSLRAAGPYISNSH